MIAETGHETTLPPHELPDGAKLNIGSGPVQPDGWDNIDGSMRARLTTKFTWADNLLTKVGAIKPTTFRTDTVYANLFKGLPYPDGVASVAYAGEVWEHFEYDDTVMLTKECFRVLKPGGVLRLCVPDGMQYWPKYIELVEAELAKPQAERSSQAIRDHMKWFWDDICTRPTRMKSFGHFHKWQFDEVQLVEMLENCGFESVARMPYHESRVPGIEKVERSDFLIVEGVKPRR